MRITFNILEEVLTDADKKMGSIMLGGLRQFCMEHTKSVI
jgi:hypothetical protein